MTKKDILKILEENGHVWCDEELEKAMKHVQSFPDDATVEDIAEGICSEWAYYWARNIGNKEIMIDRVTESEWAYYWAIAIGNKEIMIDRVTESEWAYRWAIRIGNKEIMIDRVTESESAYWWAIAIGNKEIMIDRVTEEYWVKQWNESFKEKIKTKDTK
jgi:hypothetical protein